MLAVVALLVAVTASSFIYTNHVAQARANAAVAAHTAAVEGALDAALANLEAAVEAHSRRFEEVDDLKTAQERRLLRYGNADHLQSARALAPAGRIAGRDEIDRLVAQGRLVPLGESPYFVVQELDYSMPYVTPDAAALLREMGERFHAELQERGLPLYRYVISSVLRTAENQRDLRRINPNATYGVSTHEFGTTLDVVYHKYRYWLRPDDALPPTPFPFLNDRVEVLRSRMYDALGMRYWQELQGILGRVLIDLQDEGKVKVTLERQQPVFHFTVAERLAG